MVILSFFQNTCILLAFMSVVQHFLRNRNNSKNTLLKNKILLGFFDGILGIILMINSVPVTSDTFIDFRYIPILFSAIYGGFLSVIISSIAIGGFRFLFLGISNISLLGLINTLILGTGFGVISLFKLSRKSQYIYSMLIFIIESVISSFLLPKNVTLVFQTVMLFFGGIFNSILYFN